jgi:hypothetical protein
MIEPLWDRIPGDLGPADELGVQALDWDVLDSLRGVLYGRKRSRVNSRISDPIASIAPAYLSLRRRDSVTINSANIRTRSSLLVAAASFWAKA